MGDSLRKIQKAADARNFDNDIVRFLANKDKYDLSGPIRIGTNTINGSIVEFLLETIKVLDSEMDELKSDIAALVKAAKKAAKEAKAEDK